MGSKDIISNRSRFGHIGSYRPGDTFANRLALALSGLHRPPRAGVCGTQQLGAESIVLAGQYEDDVFGEAEICYSGNGGRDPKTRHQTTDQTATGTNLALLKSVETGHPVRVLRKVPAEDGSPDVYRYEGLYQVVKSSYGPGKAGFSVYRFFLRPLSAPHQNIMNSIEQYADAHTEPESPLLAQLTRETHLQLLMPRMSSGHAQGRLLSMLSHLVQPRRILEIGTFCGYATLCLAEGLAAEGLLHTIEIDPEKETRIRRYVAAAGHEAQVKLHIGNALDVLPGLVDEVWDLVFIDADKRNNEAYFEAVINQVRPGGLLIVDNVLWSGKVLPDHELKASDKDTPLVRAFNDKVARDARVVPVFLPLRDGLLLLRKL